MGWAACQTSRGPTGPTCSGPKPRDAAAGGPTAQAKAVLLSHGGCGRWTFSDLSTQARLVAPEVQES